MRTILQFTSGSEALLLFNDRPENDFTRLARTVDTLPAPETKGTRRVFTAMVPRSFYEPVIPAASIDIGFSLACLHHLHHVDPRPADQTPTDAARQTTLRRHAHTDLQRFLSLRGREFVRGGSLVLSFVSQASTGEANYAGPVQACRDALVEMVREGLLPAAAAAEFEVPTYNRNMEDVRATLNEEPVQRDWAVEEVCEKRVVHPAAEELAAARRSGDGRMDERRYGHTIVDWLMAVVAGYFTKMLQVGLGERYCEAEGERLLQAWVERTKRRFVENHADEEVACWFIYVRLRRRGD